MSSGQSDAAGPQGGEGRRGIARTGVVRRRAQDGEGRRCVAQTGAASSSSIRCGGARCGMAKLEPGGGAQGRGGELDGRRVRAVDEAVRSETSDRWCGEASLGRMRVGGGNAPAAGAHMGSRQGDRVKRGRRNSSS